MIVAGSYAGFKLEIFLLAKPPVKDTDSTTRGTFTELISKQFRVNLRALTPGDPDCLI